MDGVPQWVKGVASRQAHVRLPPGTVGFDNFVRDLQTVIDPVDPVNYAVDAAAGHPLHVLEVLGDTAVPNGPTDYIAWALPKDDELRESIAAYFAEIEATGEPAVMGFCHCDSCRTWLAAPVHGFMLWPQANVKVVKGADQLGLYKKTENSHRQFCRSCGAAVLVGHPGLGMTDVMSVRLPSFVVSTEVLFALPDERLSIRHDAGSSPTPYVGGTLLAARAVTGRTGLTRGLDTLLLGGPS